MLFCHNWLKMVLLTNWAFDYEANKARFGFKKGMFKIKWVLLNTHFPFMESMRLLLFMGPSFKHELTYTHLLFIIFLVNSNAND